MRKVWYSAIFGALLTQMLIGCAHRNRPDAKPANTALSIPFDCIKDFQPTAICQAVSADEADCNHVRVKFHCVKVRPQHGN